MSRSFRNLVATVGCAAAALAYTLLSGCGPNTALPDNFASCKTPSVICLPAGSSEGVCVDIASDPNNCGECGNVCGTPQQGGIASCVAGECVSSCSAGLTVCGITTNTDGGGTGAAICIDTTVDPNHCGSCDTHCLDNQVCTASVCVPAGADAGTTACSFAADGGPVYANLNSDPANCGACGNACGSTEICLAGACSPCDVAQCNNVCVDTNTDPNNCGACGAVVPAGGCDNGTPRPQPVIAVLPPALTGYLPTGNPTFSVSVKSAIRLAQVTAVAKLTRNSVMSVSSVFNLVLDSDANLSPTTWSFVWNNLPTPTGGTLPALAVGDTLEIDLSAYDEQYLSTRADAAQHTSSLVWTGQVVVPVPVNLAIPTAVTTVGSAANTTLPAQSWVPLNGAPITITESPTSAPAPTAYIQGIQFRSIGGGTIILGGGGASSFIPISNGSAAITVNPADLGTGTRSIVAYQIDYFGNALNASSPLTLTVGDITLNAGTAAQPILTHGTDGTDAIWLLGAAQSTPSGSVCATPANYLVQAFDQPAASPAAVGKTVEGSSFYCQNSFFETFESTGVYGVLATGAGITRFDAAAAITDGFITPQGSNKIARIEPGSITAVALAVDDYTTDGGSGNGAFAVATKGSSANIEQEAGGADGGSFYAVPPVGGSTPATIRTSASGALWSWVQVPTGSTVAGQATQYQLDIFHPAISNNSTQIKSYLATSSNLPSTPISLSVFPGGEYVWEAVDASNGSLGMGGGRFDGTDQPVDLTGASTMSGITQQGNIFEIGVLRTLTSTGFFVPSPGILVGLVPSRSGIGTGAASTSAGYEVVEIDVSGPQAKIYHQPGIQVNGVTPSGEVMLQGVTDRFGNFNTFTVSDDLKKVLYVTKATSAAPAKDTYTINLLDLATGNSTAIYSSQFINNDDRNNNGGAGALTAYPHFLHGVNSYAGLSASSTTPTIVVWNEELPVASGAATGTVYERVFYANYAASPVTPVQVDHLAFAAYQGSPPGLAGIGGLGGTNQLLAESVKANGVFFLSDDGGGELSLYSRAFDGSGAATLLSKGVSAWNLREDVGQQVVLRVDGTLLQGALSAAGALNAIYKSDSGGEAVNLSLAPLAGITGDGTSAFVVVHADQIYTEGGSAGAPYLAGDLVTINLSTGARTNWGPAYGYLLEVSGEPFVELGTGASEALYGIDLASESGLEVRFYSATAAAATAHASILGPVNLTNFGSVTPSYSVDNKEALFSPFAGTGYDLTGDPTTATPFGPTFSLAGPAAQAQPSLQKYGPQRLPLWAFSSVSGSVLFKPFGGTYQAPITVSKTGTVTYATANNRLTPDYTQLLAHFTDGNGGQPFVMELPGTGVAPVVLPPQ